MHGIKYATSNYQNQWWPNFIMPFNIKYAAMIEFIGAQWYRYIIKSHYGDKMILWPSHLNNGFSYTGKVAPLYWINVVLVSNKYTITTCI